MWTTITEVLIGQTFLETKGIFAVKMILQVIAWYIPASGYTCSI
jgi:hypothetical protein